MYFPENMTLQYFFFDTYIGYFLQVVPIALAFGAGYFLHQQKRALELSKSRMALSSLFVSYLAALISLTLFIELIGDLYFSLIYRTPLQWNCHWFSFEYHLLPTLWVDFSGEQLGNILLFLPFGILYPLFQRKSTWKSTLLCGVITSLAIETIQPFIGRSFDINDILLNSVGVLASTVIFHSCQTMLQKHKIRS